MAQSRIEIVSYHWGLRRGSGKGEEVYNALASGNVVLYRHVSSRIG
jgi:hypothetical protein